MYKGIIFDLDGTLLDTIESIAASANQALQKYGLSTHPRDSYKMFAGDGQEELIRRCLYASGDHQYVYFERVMEEYKRVFKDGCTYEVKPFDGMIELIEQLKIKGIKLAVLSNKAHGNVKDIVKAVFGENTFQSVLGARPDYARKPSREGIDIVLGELDLTAKECIYVGDTDTDMQTGKGTGMLTVGVTWGFRSEEELVKNGADMIVHSPLDILNRI